VTVAGLSFAGLSFAGLSFAGPAAAATDQSSSAPGRVAFSVDGGATAARAGGGGATRVVGLPTGGAVLVGRGASERGFYAAELTASGTLDPSFGRRGIAHITVDSPPALPLQVLRQADGKLIVVVSGRPTTAFSFGQLLVVRLDADGRLDPTFGTRGIATAPVAPTCGACTTAALAPDGDIVLTGEAGLLSAALGGDPSAPNQWEVASLTASGGLDQTFANGGLETIPATDAGGYDIAVLASGEVMALGVADLSSTTGSTPILTLLGPDGGADRSFDGGAPAALPAGSGATAMLVEPDGSVIAGGGTTLLRYTPTGVPDPDFGDDGVAGVGPLPKPVQLLPAAGGDVLAVGRLTGAPDTLSAIRITPGGTVDQTLGGLTGIRVRPRFGGGDASSLGTVDPGRVPPLAQDDFAVHAVAVRPDGSYVAVGGVGVLAPTGNGTGRSIFDFAAAALTPDLAPVSEFGAHASKLRLKLSLPPQTAAATASQHAIDVLLDVSAAGLARVRIRASGHVIADSLVPIFGSGRHTLPVELTASGASLLRTGGRQHITASATARNLVIQGSRASASGTLG
jgi:uncharacterized delta-60 repeat protein